MSNPNNSENNQNQEEDNKQTASTESQDNSQKNSTNQKDENKGESEGFKNLRNAHKEQSKKLKEYEAKLLELENKNKPDATLEDEVKKLKSELEQTKTGLKKTEIKNQALELGLNPSKKAIFEKHFLENLTKQDNVSQALAEFKEEMPEFFQEPKVNLTNSPSGGSKGTNITKEKAIEILNSGSSSEYLKYEKEIQKALLK